MLEQAWDALTGGMLSWYQAKMFIEHASSVSSDALHVIAGVIVWVLIALALRRPISSGVPLAWLLAVVLFNEAVDLWVERWPDLAMQYGESAKDLMVTMALPALFMALVRLRPQLFVRRGRRGPGGRSRRA
jgi:hypothetical protein